MTDAAALHSRLFKIDTHTDTPTASLMRAGWDFGARHTKAADHSQCDLPRMESGGIDAMVFAIFSAQSARTPEGFAAAQDLTLRVIGRTHDAIRQNANRCALALSAADGLKFKAEGRRAIYLSLENSQCLGRDVRSVRRFYDQGVRMLGLTHMLNNELCDSSTDPRGIEWGGLSPFGREVVRECNKLGLVVDASHSSDKTLWDLLECSKAPVILSHSGCRAVCDHPRNIGDDLLRALAAKGGVIQINALPIAVIDTPEDGRTAALAEMLLKFADRVMTDEAMAEAGREWQRIEASFPNPTATLDDYIKHIEHAVRVAGIDHVGIGCDFDGGGGVKGMNDVGEYPNLTAALVARGWTEPDLAKLWGENTRRIYAGARV